MKCSQQLAFVICAVCPHEVGFVVWQHRFRASAVVPITLPCQPLSYDHKSRFMHILRPVAKLPSRWMAFCCRCRTSFWMPLGYLFPKLSPRFCTFLESLHNRPEVLQPPISARISRFCKFCIG
ncbi:uncharacterized protein [Lolium perenne]|nr:uncharacterized protein LOC127311524 [Lolium perenne]